MFRVKQIMRKIFLVRFVIPEVTCQPHSGNLALSAKHRWVGLGWDPQNFISSRILKNSFGLIFSA